ncbi:MAG: accessory gene regulator B family protein [Syntrophomonas sp.]|nr:accessory gene regulator B family protein [Syntrophomonas sp.]
MNSLAKKLAHLLAENASHSVLEDEIRYGLEIALGGLLQAIIIMVVALLLGIGKEVLAIITTAALYRRYSGGPHCQAYYRCTITSLVSFVVLGYVSRYIPANYLSGYIIGLAIMSLYLIHYYVPVDNPINPITDESTKRKRKIKSYWILLLVLLASTVFGEIMDKKLVAIALLLGMFWQNFTLLPWGHTYVHLWDQFFEKTEKFLKGEEVMKC